jgi:hypothetical protein
MDRFRLLGGVDQADRPVDQLDVDLWRSLVASLE